MADCYEQITDWSLQGRAALIDERGQELALLLDEAFTIFIDRSGVSLSAFGFRGEDDPVTAAVEWSLQRFATADLDPSKLQRGSDSFRLFTEPAFWLSQKVGARGFRAIMGRRPQLLPLDEERADSGEATDQSALRRRVALGLSAFRQRTCASMVGFWLHGSRRLCGTWFGWTAPDLPKESAKRRSFHIADALFRFLVLFAALVELDGQPERVAAASLLSSCPDSHPYRAVDAVVLEAEGLSGPRALERLRREGVERWLRRCIIQAERPVNLAVDPLITGLARASLKKSLLHLYKINDPQIAADVRRVAGLELA